WASFLRRDSNDYNRLRDGGKARLHPCVLTKVLDYALFFLFLVPTVLGGNAYAMTIGINFSKALCIPTLAHGNEGNELNR
ncbi:MAG: hypothetical protein Q9N02_02630, partial [Ghiorsea sp.]|nr:hypothetical protein [Ghiorsea sp.]